MAESQSQQAHRNVHKKYYPPAKLHGEPSTQGRAYHEAEISHAGLEAKHFSSTGRGKIFGQNRRRVGEQHRGADPLKNAKSDQRLGSWGEPAQRRSEDEQREPRYIQTLVAAQIAQPAETQ